MSSATATRVGFIEPFYGQIGPHQVLLNLLSRLDRARFAPYAAVPRARQDTDDLVRLGVVVSSLSGARNVLRPSWPGALVGEMLKSTAGGMQVRGFARRNHIDLIHVNNETCWAGLVGARLAGLPSIVHVHGLGFASSRFVARQFGKLLNATSDRVVAVSGAVRTALLSAGVESRKIRIVYNGIDTDRFRPGQSADRVRREFQINPGERSVGMFGGLDPRKGHRLFLRAAAIVRERHPQTRFFIVGGDVPTGADEALVKYRNELLALAAELGIKDAVVFTGGRTDIPELLSLMDVVVQPSQTDAGPLVPLEAMSTGKPVVATDVGGNPEEVEHGESGLIVPAGSAPALAEGILALLEDEDQRIRFGTAGRSRAEKLFSAHRMAEQVQAIYDELVHERRQM